MKISGMVDLYVGNDSDVITVRGGNSSYDIDKAPTAYIGGGAIKAAMGRAAVVSGGELSINSKLQDGAIVVAEGSRDVQVEGNILVKDQQKDQGILTLGMNTDKSYFKGTISMITVPVKYICCLPTVRNGLMKEKAIIIIITAA